MPHRRLSMFLFTINSLINTTTGTLVSIKFARDLAHGLDVNSLNTGKNVYGDFRVVQ
jgi:hypothetical protein